MLKILHALATTEFASVEQHQPWINQGPTAEDRFIQAQITADGVHQGFIDTRLLRTFGPEASEKADELLELRIGEHPIEAFNVLFESWAMWWGSVSAWIWSPGTICMLCSIVPTRPWPGI
ncbi:MAG: hypothetical protein CMM74_05910 [Rhodospirillaceae bacterium]|nr:hypothetical protein [Rhodospirillaceae bacterium]